MKKSFRYISPVLFGLLIYASIRLVNDTTAQEKFWEKPWETNAIEITTVILVSFLIQAMLDFLIRKFSAGNQTRINKKVILREFTIVFLGSAIIVNTTIIPMAALTDDGLGLNDVAIANLIPALYVLLYFAIARGNNYLQAYVDKKVQLEKITNDHLETELKFLKAQFHPHFLFNALNTIYFQMDEDVNAAKKSVERFSELLRYQLYDQQQTVPVHQEITYLENFIQLQQLRSSKDLKLSINIHESINGQQVYPLLFLPLVENAFKYVGGENRIHIKASAASDQIDFQVVNSTDNRKVQTENGGIGLENLKRRLQLLYPSKHTLSISDLPGEYKVILNIIISRHED